MRDAGQWASPMPRSSLRPRTLATVRASTTARASTTTRRFGGRCVVGALAAVLVLAACGSETSEPDESSSPATSSAATSGPAAPDDSEETTVTDPGDGAPAPTDDATGTQPAPQPVEPEPVDPAPTSGLPLGPVPDEVVARAEVQDAVADLAAREGVDARDVSVAGYADVTWPDGSLGCPEPGVMYTQALVPGHQLILQIDDTTFSYHAAEGRDFTYCASPGMPLPADSGSS